MVGFYFLLSYSGRAFLNVDTITYDSIDDKYDYRTNLTVQFPKQLLKLFLTLSTFYVNFFLFSIVSNFSFLVLISGKLIRSFDEFDCL